MLQRGVNRPDWIHITDSQKPLIFKMHMPENWIAFVIAIFLPMIIGSLWYGPLFGKMWMRMMNLTEEKIKETLNPAKSYGGSMVGSVLTAYVLSMLITLMDMGTFTGGLTVGFAAWVGFFATTRLAERSMGG